MFRIECPNCHSKLNAKEKLIGQVRPCPKCKAPLKIELPPPEPAASMDWETAVAEKDSPKIDFTPTAAPESRSGDPDQRHAVGGLGFTRPHRLDPDSKYLILGPNGLVAKWESSTKGWELKTTVGFTAAKRNAEAIPKEGRFVLIEIVVRTVEAVGHRLGGLRVFRLAPRWALGAMAHGEDEILKKIEGHSGLIRDQKLAVRRYLRESYMPEFTHRAHAVTAFLTGDDFHAHTILENEER